MTSEEINKVISEYMDIWEEGFNYTFDGSSGFWREPCAWHRSLDALVSVWEKLDIFPNPEFDRYTDKSRWVCNYGGWDGDAPTIQEAAACATATAILELKNDN